MGRSTTVLLLAVVWPALLSGQTVDDVRRLAAAGDTSGAIAAAEAAIKANKQDAEAHYLAGLLYLSQHIPGAKVSAPRRKAEEHLRYATRFEPDSAKYWLALGDLFRAEDLVTVRLQVAGLFQHAAEALAAHPTDSLAGEVGFRAARLEWERYEHYGRRYQMSEAGRQVAIPGSFAEWKYWEEFYERGVTAVPSSDESLRNAEAALWQVLGTNPADVRCTGLLMVVMGETHRWEETVPLARRLVRQVPDSGRAWALLGLAYARTRHWGAANAAFDSAFAHMTPDEVAPYHNLGRIMRKADRVRWESLPDDEKANLDSIYWAVAQPLTLTGQNEVQAEFYARLTYAEHRWTDPWLGFRGYETDIGAVYVAYGPPDGWMVFDRQLIVWLYLASHYRFTFNLTPGFTRARFDGDSREGLRVAQEESPARFDNVGVYRTLDTILIQAAEFRGRGDTTAVAVFGAIPLTRVVDSAPLANMRLMSGAIVTDSAGHALQRDRRNEIVRAAGPDGVLHRSWRLGLTPGDYLLRAEAYVPDIDRGARAVEPLRVRHFARDSFALSDVLAASRVAPRDSLATRWTDFYIEPNGGRFLPGSSLGLLWEIYGLPTDTLGFADYTVELRLTVESIERHSFIAQIVGGVADAAGLSAVGDDRVSLSYTRRTAPSPDGVVPEYVTVELRDAPEGRYTVAIVVQDHRTGATATAERVVLVNRDPPVRRTHYTSFW